MKKKDFNASKKYPKRYKTKNLKNRKRKKTIKKTYFLKEKILKYLLYFILVLTVSFAILLVALYFKYIKDLPSVKELENLDIKQTSVIYDAKGEELYNLYSSEKRTYIGYQDISENMVHAIVAGEDKRFWENSGIDPIGLARAVLYRLINKSDKLEGTSTLTQQLIKNSVLSNERKLERKIKEIYLSIKLTGKVSKEKILELYLNKISFGSNAFGIEQAAKTFFGKQARDLDVLESSILASLPKGPTAHSPYSNPDRLMGYPYYYPASDSNTVTKIISAEEVKNNQNFTDPVTNFIQKLSGKELSSGDLVLCGITASEMKGNFPIDKQGCVVLDYSLLLNFLNDIQITVGENIVEYQTGRKDFILQRMLEDKYITFDEYKAAVLGGVGYSFKKYRDDIKHPHFVFYIREYIEEKYGAEVLDIGGLHIHTTLDPVLQKKAEEVVEAQSKLNESQFAAGNGALVSIDNRTGTIVAMVGGKDYFDTENKGNVNIITSKLQPGSTFKPFVYSLATKNSRIGSKTPVYDVETNFPSYKPGNFDGRFQGKMDLSSALNTSRNIPAVKMFYMAGGEVNTVNFMKTLGVESLKEHGRYGAPLALGTGEMTPLELASAYAVFANSGVKKEITAVEKILDSQGNIIESREQLQKEEKVMEASQAYIMNTILSDTATRPEFWNKYLSLSGRKMAAKTGTSTKQYTKYGRKYIYPRNLWTIGYTPQYTTVAWAGNTDGTELNNKGNGLEGAGPMMKNFMQYAHIGEPVKTWYQPTGVKNITLSSVSGGIASENTPEEFRVDSLHMNTPNYTDTSMQPIQVDALCNGIITDATPIAARRTVYMVNINSLIPSNTAWENPVQAWLKEKGGAYFSGYPNLVNSVSSEACERVREPSEIEIASTTKNGEEFITGVNYIELAYRSAHPIQKIDVLLGEAYLSSISLSNKTQGTYTGTFDIPVGYLGSFDLVLRAVDDQFYSHEERKKIIVSDSDTSGPLIEMKSPRGDSVVIEQTESIEVSGRAIDRGGIQSVNIFLNNAPLVQGLRAKYSYVLNKNNDIAPGIYTLKIEAVDKNNNSSVKNLQVEVLGAEDSLDDDISGPDAILGN